MQDYIHMALHERRQGVDRDAAHADVEGANKLI